MRGVSSLRRELVVALGLLLIAAVGVAIAVLLWLPLAEPLPWVIAALCLLVVLDVAAFLAFGDFLFRQLILRPLGAILHGAERIAGGEYAHRVRVAGSAELRRLAVIVNELAERLVQNQQRLSDNIRSLNEVNRELTEARDELVRAEKLASAGQLAAGIAHEIGNPLGAILGYLEVVERRPAIGKELVHDMRREARRIDRIVKGLLDYARPRQPAPRPIDVNDVVQDAVDLMEAQGHFKGIELSMSLATEATPVEADPYQLQQILVNLLLNAVQAVQGTERQLVQVSTGMTLHQSTIPPIRRRDDPPGIDYSHLRRLQARREGITPPPFTVGLSLVNISIADSGPGIPEEIIDRVFDPFFTTKETGEGTGLGLAVSARLIEGMGGTIRVDSMEGEGACFSILLPAVDESPFAANFGIEDEEIEAAT